MVKFENREIWADLENRSKVVHSEIFPIWRPASGHRDHVTHHVTSHVTHWGQWKCARGTLSAIAAGRSNLCTGPKFRAAAPNIVADQNVSVVLDLLKMITIGWSHFQSASNKPLKFVYFGRVGYFNWYPCDKRTNCESCVNQVVKIRTNVGYQFW